MKKSNLLISARNTAEQCKPRQKQQNKRKRVKEEMFESFDSKLATSLIEKILHSKFDLRID